jgi:diaminohydroxyphosphoribosylaminopyrimidine deaminase / 5-amino-6-(5-phosphoribosylamino)uracil reductase
MRDLELPSHLPLTQACWRVLDTPHVSDLPEPMRLALRLAASALFLTSPNPRVGCVLTNPQGEVIGQGHTQAVGGPHAEIMALRDAQQRGHSPQDATAWVTLEPCAHHGRTGPCTQALIQAGIAQVVASLQDPNPLVAGQGFAQLRAAGVEVTVGPGADLAQELNIGFLQRMRQGKPWVRLKTAISLDGQTALHNGQSEWITGPEARADGHAWRARGCAVLTGVGTVLADDPQLDVRAISTPRQPHLALVDSRLETPPAAKLWQAAPTRQIHMYCAKPMADPAATKHALAQATGVNLERLHLHAFGGAQGKVDLPAMLADLAQQHQINELHVECGHQLAGSLLKAGLVNELLVYQAPMLLGPGQPLARLPELQELAQAKRWHFHDHAAIGKDLRVLMRSSVLAPFEQRIQAA